MMARPQLRECFGSPSSRLCTVMFWGPEAKPGGTKAGAKSRYGIWTGDSSASVLTLSK